MFPFEDSLRELAKGVSANDPTTHAQQRAAIEADLEPVVRRALSHGAGHPALVNWVRRALPRVTGGAAAARPADYAGPLARLLCRTLVERTRPVSYAASPAGWETVAGS
jgi:hypothetical protein